jgi:hypothetical protein
MIGKLLMTSQEGCEGSYAGSCLPIMRGFAFAPPAAVSINAIHIRPFIFCCVACLVELYRGLTVSWRGTLDATPTDASMCCRYIQPQQRTTKSCALKSYSERGQRMR